MNIFECDNYKEFVQQALKKRPKMGYGQFKRLAEHLQITSVLVSQIFNGEKNLTHEQALATAEFLSLTEPETKYFVYLVSHERAGSKSLKNFYENEMRILRKNSKDLKKVLPQDAELSEAEKATFYSDWFYSAIRLATSLPGLDTPEALSERFQIPREKVVEVLDFLLKQGLCVSNPKGGYAMGPQRIHLEAHSPYVKARQVTWRIKSMQHMNPPLEEKLFYTAPMSLSQRAYKEIRADIVAMIAKLNEKVAGEEPSELACLNIDLFRF